MGSDPLAGSAVTTNNASNTLRMPHLNMANILDDICEDGPVLSAEMARPKGVSKRQVVRCIHELSEHWSDEQLNDVIDMFQAHGLI